MKQNIQKLQKLVGLYIQTKKDGSDKFMLSNIRRRIIDLIKSLSHINTSYIRKTIAFSMMVIGLGTAQAQTFAPVQVNPFALSAQGHFNSPVLVDLDNDGDLDILNSGYYTSPIQYFENTGSAANPTFGTPQNNPFGLSTPADTYLNRMALADMDGDGDMDIISSADYYNAKTFKYSENTGTANAPSFAAPVYGLGGSDTLDFIGQNYISAPTLGDLDGDGDIDILIGVFGFYNSAKLAYYENTGTATNPIFGTPVNQPFNMGTGLTFYAVPHLTDIDNDGDLDILYGDYDTYGAISLYENTGTAQAPNFGPTQNNPFGLTSIETLAFITSGDLDNDGDIDLLVGEYDTYTYLSNFNYFANQDATVSVQELDLSDVSVYPSPATDMVNLNLTFTPETLIITDALGKVVKTIHTLNTTNVTIDISDLDAGMYTIIIGNDNRRGTKRFVKQ